MFHSLHKNDVGTNKKSVHILTKDDEDKLWECGVLDSYTLQGLQNEVFLCWQNMLSKRRR